MQSFLAPRFIGTQNPLAMVKPELRVEQFETNSCVHYYQDRWLPIIGEQLEFIKNSQLMD